MIKRPSDSPSYTVIDVAREAGVSLSTAARVLRGEKYPVSESLASRVHEAAKRLGYVPNLLARNLRGQTKNSLGLVIGSMSEPLFGWIADVITAEANTRSLSAMVATMHRDPLLEIAMCRRLFEHRANGLILGGGGFDQATHLVALQDILGKLERANVVIASLSERPLPVQTFSVNNVEVGELMATEALNEKHHEIGVITSSTGFVVQRRAKAIVDLLAKNKIKPTLVNADEFTFSGAGAAVDELLRINPRISIILATTDTLGIGAVIHLNELGRRVPDEISVIGVGNTEFCEMCTPRLSSVDIGVELGCIAAVDYIVAKWEDRPTTDSPVIPARFVRRDSLGTRKS